MWKRYNVKELGQIGASFRHWLESSDGNLSRGLPLHYVGKRTRRVKSEKWRFLLTFITIYAQWVRKSTKMCWNNICKIIRHKLNTIANMKLLRWILNFYFKSLSMFELEINYFTNLGYISRINQKFFDRQNE